MKRKDNMSWWVYWSLWGIESRKAAMEWFIAALILCMITALVGIYIKDYSLLFLPLLPFWYWGAIQWVDKNSSGQ